MKRFVVSAALAVVATLGGGVAAAAASTQPSLVGFARDTNVATGLTSGTVSVAAENVGGNWYAYTPSFYSNELTAIEVSGGGASPQAPAILNGGSPPGTQVEGADTINIFNGIAYVVSKNENATCSNPVPPFTGCSNDNGTGNALTEFDVSTDPTTPTYIASIQDTSDGGGTNGVSDAGTALFGAYGVTVTQIGGTTYALVAAQGCLTGQPACPPTSGPTLGNDLAVIDVSTTPGSPQLVGSVANNTVGPTNLNDLDHPTAVAVSGNYAYVTSFYGKALTVVDVSNPTNPRVVTSLANATDFPSPADVTIQGNYAYVINQNTNTQGQGTLTVVNIANPASPTVVATVNAIGLSQGYRIRVSGNFAYVSARGVAAVTAIDISNPAAPYVITSVISTAYLQSTTGLDVMNIAGSEYVVASSPYLSTESNYIFPPFPAPGNSAQKNTGTISLIQLDPVIDTPTINPSSEPATTTYSTAANFNFATADAVSTVACSLDGSAYAPCTTLTSQQYGGLALGQHSFSVQSTDAAGNTNTASYTWTIQAPPVPPVNTAPPAVTGSTVVGGTLTASTGSWSGSPTSYAYQWQRCNAQGTSCVGLNTTGSTYTVGTIDIGNALRVVVTASNGVGSTTAISAVTPVVAACGPVGGTLPAYCQAPKLKAHPVVTGTMEVGERLVASAGTWSTLPASAYGAAQLATTKSQWLRCNAHGAACAAIRGARNSVYKTTKKDLGHTLRLHVVATNRNGSSSASSAPSARILAAGTKVSLAVKFSPGQPLVRHGYVLASVKSNVGAFLDALFAFQIGNGGIHWTTGVPAQAQPGRFKRFKIVLTPGEAQRLRSALSHHEHLTAAVQGARVLFPQHSGSQQTKEYKFHPKR